MSSLTVLIDSSPLLHAPHDRPAIRAFHRATSVAAVLAALSADLVPHAAPVYWSFASGKPLPADSAVPVSALAPADSSDTNLPYVHLRANLRLPGGKGGFGTMLKAQGGKMSNSKRRHNQAHAAAAAAAANSGHPVDSYSAISAGSSTENDSYKTVDGRRYRSIRQAKELAAYLDAKKQLTSTARQTKREKIEARTRQAPTPKTLYDPELQDDLAAATSAIKDSVEAAASALSTATSLNPAPAPPKPKKASAFFDADLTSSEEEE